VLAFSISKRRLQNASKESQLMVRLFSFDYDCNHHSMVFPSSFLEITAESFFYTDQEMGFLAFWIAYENITESLKRAKNRCDVG
jgi:hypothetical protein